MFQLVTVVRGQSSVSCCPVRGQSSVSYCPVRGVRDRPPPSTCCGPGTGLTRWAAGLGRNMLIRVDVIQVITSVRPHHCCSSHHQTFLLESFLPMWCSEEVNRTWSTGVHLYFLPVFFRFQNWEENFLNLKTREASSKKSTWEMDGLIIASIPPSVLPL